MTNGPQNGKMKSITNGIRAVINGSDLDVDARSARCDVKQVGSFGLINEL
jgi:hypothetical protein